MRIELVKFEFGHLFEAARSETALVCPRLSSLWAVLLLPVVRMAAGALAGLIGPKLRPRPSPLGLASVRSRSRSTESQKLVVSWSSVTTACWSSRNFYNVW